MPFVGCGGGLPTGTGGSAVLSGQIKAPGSAKLKAQGLDRAADQGYMVVAQNNDTGAIYRGVTDAAGAFELSIPEGGAGSFVVTIIGPDGRAEGPVVLGQNGAQGVTGLALQGGVSLGTMNLPDNPEATPIVPGGDANVGDKLVPEVVARLNDAGAPVGLATHGKGAAAMGAAGSGADADKDGLVDIVDADDDGDGIVDDFDTGGGGTGAPPDVRVNFFMNLKIQAEEAQTYYAGTQAQRDAARATNTIITFEAMTEPSATRTITGVRVLDTPAPTYLPSSTKMAGQSWVLWSDSGYAFDAASDRFNVWVRPNAVMDAGDTFTAEITFGDGSTEQYSRMLNYVFKNIPKLLQYGSAGALTNFDVADPVVNGSPGKPIPFNGAQDLVLVFNPPLDETGAYMTGLAYSFQMFYQGATGNQLNGDIDGAATWPTPPVGFQTQNLSFYVQSQNLTLAPDNTYTFTLPKAVLPATVRNKSSADVAVGSFKIDITAEAPTGNAAIMLTFVRQ